MKTVICPLVILASAVLASAQTLPGGGTPPNQMGWTQTSTIPASTTIEALVITTPRNGTSSPVTYQYFGANGVTVWSYFVVAGYNGSSTPPWTMIVSVLSSNTWSDLFQHSTSVDPGMAKKIYVVREKREGTESWVKVTQNVSRDLDMRVWDGTSYFEVEF